MLSERVFSRIGSETREETAEQMSKRVPSFFTSASLVNMSGLGITDGYNLDDISDGNDSISRLHREIPAEPPSGWNGLGMKGNSSSGSLNRSTGSGLFPMDYESDEEKLQANNVLQLAGEDGPQRPKSRSQSMDDDRERQYLKTTSMSNFYYRTPSNLEKVAADLTKNESLI